MRDSTSGSASSRRPGSRPGPSSQRLLTPPYVVSKGLEGIEVRENAGGAGDVALDFRVMGVRSAMPDHVAIRDNEHFAPQPGTSVPDGRPPGRYRELRIANGTLGADGGVDAASAARLGWSLENGAWTGGARASAPPSDR